MLVSASTIVPLIMTAVLVASGVAKLARPDDLGSWAELGVPAWLRRPWLLRAHPWAEIALGAAIAVLGGALGLAAALASVALMAAYLLLVYRAFRRAENASCACFGSRAPITRVTVVRNVWLTLVAAATAALVWVNPLWGGAIAALAAVGALGWVALACAIVAAVTTLLVAWPTGGSAAPSAIADGGDDEYVRVRIPAVPVRLADGTKVSLRQLALRRPLLLLAVSPACGACTPVVESVPRWRELLPEVDVRLLLTIEPGKDRYTERTEPQSLHDVHDYVRDSIADWGVPTAVLLGADGLLAGGPVTGVNAIDDFVGFVRDSLDEIASRGGVAAER